MSPVLRLERHALGPRVHVLGRRVHEYHVGLALLALAPRAALASAAGIFLIVKDWPDLFPATRDRASWRLGIHRLPPRQRRRVKT
jgi:hypothetical protein